MSGLVDVRQWLGDERFMYGPGTESRAKCEEAYAAVAELIEAASEVDRLSRDFSVWDDPESVERAVLRQRAALARIQGGA